MEILSKVALAIDSSMSSTLFCLYIFLVRFASNKENLLPKSALAVGGSMSFTFLFLCFSIFPQRTCASFTDFQELCADHAWVEAACSTISTTGSSESSLRINLDLYKDMLATTARCILYNKSLTGLADKIFDQLLSAWEAFSAAERLKAEQDSELFKSKNSGNKHQH